MMHQAAVNGFDEAEDFKEFMKSAIRREKELTSRRIEEGASMVPAEQLDQYYDFYAEDYFKIGDIFERLALESFLVMLYSRIEAGMGTLCNVLRLARQDETGKRIDLKFSDLKGHPLDQARLYMEKVLVLHDN
jgi:hypothetical protein